MLASQDYEVSQSEWGEGDVFVLYTDGIFEAENKDGEQFGEERLKRLVMENIHLTPDLLEETILSEFHSCFTKLFDDGISKVCVTAWASCHFSDDTVSGFPIKAYGMFGVFYRKTS